MFGLSKTTQLRRTGEIRILFPPIRLAGSEEEEDEGHWKLYFKLYCFLDVESMPKEGVEFAFMFEQVSQSINRSINQSIDQCII